ncbi:hypothetical protein AAFG07_32060 [Bradyrhizobium sp. B097]
MLQRDLHGIGEDRSERSELALNPALKVVRDMATWRGWCKL